MTAMAKIEKREGMLFIEGNPYGYVQRTVLEERVGSDGEVKLVIKDKPTETVLVINDKPQPYFWFSDLHFVAHDIAMDIGDKTRTLNGMASLTKGCLSIIGNDSHRSRKVRFDFYQGPWSAWPEWSASIAFYGDRDAKIAEPDGWFLTAYLPSSVFEELTVTYHRDALARLSFSFVSDLWQRQGPIDVGLAAGGKLANFRWSEKSKPIGDLPRQGIQNYLRRWLLK